MSNDMRKAPPDYDCQRHGDPPSGFVCPKCGSTMDENPRRPAMDDDMRKALEHAQARFECLAEDFKAAGDTTSWAMCSVDAGQMFKTLNGPATPSRPVSGEPVAWLYEVDMGGGHWSQKYTDAKPAGNKWQRNIRPLYLAPPPAPVADRAAVIEECAKAAEKAWPRAHTYASENADLYRGQDHAVRTAVKAIRALAAKGAA